MHGSVVSASDPYSEDASRGFKLVVSMKEKLYLHWLVLVGSRYGLECNLLKQI